MKGELKYEMELFKVPVKVEQINEYLFSDTVQSQNTKSGSDEISQGQNRTEWIEIKSDSLN